MRNTIDLHHRAQRSLLAALEHQLTKDADREEAAKTLGRLLEFTKVHFEEEERIMRKCEYPSLGDHASSHGRLLAEALSLAQAYGAGDLPVAKLTVARLRESLENHIQGEDATFEAWCHRAGIVLE